MASQTPADLFAARMGPVNDTPEDPPIGTAVTTNDGPPETAEKTNDALADKIADLKVESKPAEESTPAAAPGPNGESDLLESTYEVAVKLADMQGDPDSPLYSAKRFEDLGISKELLEGLMAMNFKKPSKIQERALPLMLSNPPTNMIGQSQSGTGKTAAFVLTMLSRIDHSNPAPQALCLAPSRELARQIMGVIKQMSQFTTVKTAFAIQGDPPRGQRIDGQVVVGTPGTAIDLIRRRFFPTNQLKVFVLDEADNMLGLAGMQDQSLRVKNAMPPTCQILLFSATFPQEVVEFAPRFAPNANQITLKHEELTVEGIKQLYMDCDSEADKYRILVDLYHIMTIGSSIIFVKRRDTAAEIQRRMEADGHKVAALHGAQDGADRDRVIDDFREGRAKVLITTNVLARGIDVATVSLVVNYDIPLDAMGRPDPETYLHRIGRTGRFGRVGVSISFVHDKKSWTDLNEIQQYFGVEMTAVPTRDPDEVEAVIKKALKRPAQTAAKK